MSDQQPESGESDARELLRYLPNVLVELIHSHASDKRASRWREHKEVTHAAFVFLDIYGLHRLSEALPTATETAEGGKDAARFYEQRRGELLNAWVGYFERLVAICDAHGGDVVKFTGDGLLVVWPFVGSGEDGARRAAVSACRCAFQLLADSGTLLWSEAGPVGGGVTGMRPLVSTARPALGSDEAGGPIAAPSQPTSDARALKAAQQERDDRSAAHAKVERVRELSTDPSDFDTINQGGLILMPGELADRVLDLVGPQQVGVKVAAPRHRLSLAAGVGVGDLFSIHVGSKQRWEYVLWGERLAEVVKAVQLTLSLNPNPDPDPNPNPCGGRQGGAAARTARRRAREPGRAHSRPGRPQALARYGQGHPRPQLAAPHFCAAPNPTSHQIRIPTWTHTPICARCAD